MFTILQVMGAVIVIISVLIYLITNSLFNRGKISSNYNAPILFIALIGVILLVHPILYPEIQMLPGSEEEIINIQTT